MHFDAGIAVFQTNDCSFTLVDVVNDTKGHSNDTNLLQQNILKIVQPTKYGLSLTDRFICKAFGREQAASFWKTREAHYAKFR